MKLLIALDLWLLSRVFEPLAWRIEAIFKISCFKLSRYTLTLGVASREMVYIKHVHGLAWQVPDLLITTAMWMFLLFLSIGQEKKVLRSPQYQNPFKNESVIRLIYLPLPLAAACLSVLHHRQVLDTITSGVGAVLLICYIYFNSCNPLPPGWKKEQKMSKNMAPVTSA